MQIGKNNRYYLKELTLNRYYAVNKDNAVKMVYTDDCRCPVCNREDTVTKKDGIMRVCRNKEEHEENIAFASYRHYFVFKKA